MEAYKRVQMNIFLYNGIIIIAGLAVWFLEFSEEKTRMYMVLVLFVMSVVVTMMLKSKSHQLKLAFIEAQAKQMAKQQQTTAPKKVVVNKSWADVIREAKNKDSKSKE